jgi:integrase
MPTPPRPAPRSAGPYRYRVARGPRDDEGTWRWYWRCLRYVDGGEESAWVGWGTVEEADERTARLITGAPEPGQARTVRDLLSLWHGAIESRSDLAPATVRGYGDAAIRLRDVIGATLVGALDRLTIERYRDARLRAGSTPRTVKKDLTILGLAWRWAREVGHVEVGRELPRVAVLLDELTHPRVRAPDLQAALDALEAAGRHASRLHLLLVGASGCRVSEIGALRRRDVDGRWITVTGKRRTRRIPLPVEVADELAAWIEAHPGSPDGTVLGYHGASARELLFRYLREAGIPWRPKDARRARVNAVYASGVDPGVAAKLLGHSPEVALRYYRDAMEEELLDAVDHPEPPPKPTAPRPRRTSARRARR